MAKQKLEIDCPICDAKLSIDARSCPRCGADLGMADFQDLEDLAKDISEGKTNFEKPSAKEPGEIKAGTETKVEEEAIPPMKESKPQAMEPKKESKPQAMEPKKESKPQAMEPKKESKPQAEPSAPKPLQKEESKKEEMEEEDEAEEDAGKKKGLFSKLFGKKK